VSPIEGLVLDMEGVIHVGWEPLPGAPEAIADLAARGIELAVLTNTTGRTRAEIARRLAAMRVALPAERIVSAASAAAEHLRAHHAGARVYALVEREAREELAGVELVERPDDADVVLLGGPGDDWTYARLHAVFRAVRGGAALVAMQRNRWWPTAEGPALDAGMFVVGLEYATGREAVTVGKPAPEIYRAACALVAAEPGRAMMVGDDLESDLAPARAIGLRTCLVRTGKGGDFTPAEGDVDLDLPSLAELPAALDRAG
jgi:HAD superfamily hydrolase (TIGR01450 family)